MPYFTSTERTVLALSAHPRERKARSRFGLIRRYQALLGSAPPPPLADPRLEALRVLGASLHGRIGATPSPVALAAFVAAGWTSAEAVHIGLLVRAQQAPGAPRDRPASAMRSRAGRHDTPDFAVRMLAPPVVRLGLANDFGLRAPFAAMKGW